MDAPRVSEFLAAERLSQFLEADEDEAPERVRPFRFLDIVDPDAKVLTQEEHIRRLERFCAQLSLMLVERDRALDAARAVPSRGEAGARSDSDEWKAAEQPTLPDRVGCVQREAADAADPASGASWARRSLSRLQRLTRTVAQQVSASVMAPSGLDGSRSASSSQHAPAGFVPLGLLQELQERYQHVANVSQERMTSVRNHEADRRRQLVTQLKHVHSRYTTKMADLVEKAQSTNRVEVVPEDDGIDDVFQDDFDWTTMTKKSAAGVETRPAAGATARENVKSGEGRNTWSRAITGKRIPVASGGSARPRRDASVMHVALQDDSGDSADSGGAGGGLDTDDEVLEEAGRDLREVLSATDDAKLQELLRMRATTG